MKKSYFILIFAILLFYFGAKIRSVTAPVFGALFLAYLAYPFVRFTSRRLPKIVGAVLFYALIFSFVALIFYFILPTVSDGLGEIYKYISSNSHIFSFISREKLLSYISEKADSLSAFLKNTVNMVSKCAVSVVLSCLFVMDFDTLKQSARSLIPEALVPALLPAIREIDAVFRSFFRGQLLVSVILSAITYFTLLFLKIRLALILSIFYGIFCLIPTIGPIIGAIPVVAVAYLQSPSSAIFALGAIILTQIIDNSVISPKIKADSVDISPAAAFTAIYLGAGFFGLFGIILGVPVYAALKIILRRIISAIA